MAVRDYFADTYVEARKKFLAAANAAGAMHEVHTLPDLRAPDGEPLTMDVATLGPSNPDAVLLLISGTHGVEGFAGSGCQIGYLADQLYSALPARTATILIHALNPYGFAWLRRVNEIGIDLNRNFQDFSKALPDSSAYEAIHDLLIPDDWEGPGRMAADAAMQEHVKALGMARFQAAVSGGQYSRPLGLFYGGTAESWSNTTLRRILKNHLAPTVRNLAIFDFHTGLGPTGYGEPIYTGTQDAGFERAKRWYGPELTSMTKGTSTSADVAGSVAGAFGDLSPAVAVTYVALEYGTRPLLEVLTALRADHWLHAITNRQTPLRDQIKRQIRDAFYPDSPAWKAAVYGRAADFVLRACRGLGSVS